AVDQGWTFHSRLYETHTGQRSSERSYPLTAKEPEYETRSVSNWPTAIIQAPQTPAADMRLDMTVGIRRVHAVAGEIREDTVIVKRQRPTGQVEISIPPVFIPSELRNFGMPIQI